MADNTAAKGFVMRQALELALEALKENVHELIAENKALKESLRQPEQEPDKYVMDIECTKCGAKQSGVLTVNTTPPQRKPLTDEEIQELWESTASYYNVCDFARAIEAAHGIKE